MSFTPRISYPTATESILKFSAIVSRLFLSLAFLTATVANATPLTWTFQGVTFDDGASLSGYLEVESSTVENRGSLNWRREK